MIEPIHIWIATIHTDDIYFHQTSDHSCCCDNNFTLQPLSFSNRTLLIRLHINDWMLQIKLNIIIIHFILLHNHNTSVHNMHVIWVLGFEFFDLSRRVILKQFWLSFGLTFWSISLRIWPCIKYEPKTDT